MAEQQKQVGGGRRSIGDIAPKLASLTDDVLFDDVWNREGLAARDRSLITVAALVAGGDAAQLEFHLGRAVENGVTPEELLVPGSAAATPHPRRVGTGAGGPAITHLAFSTGWPKAMTAIGVARKVLATG